MWLQKIKMFAVVPVLFTNISLFGQDQNVQQLISEGIALHDEGRYDEAIARYRSALILQPGSSLASYEMAFSYFRLQKYDSSIKYGSQALDQNNGSQHESYIVLGNSFDLMGQPGKAIKVYEEGLKNYPNSNLLNYNLALTCFNQKDYKKAEQAVINAINARPTHASSHSLLAVIMKQSGKRIKSILPLYYFLMLEPNSSRSVANYKSLRSQLDEGVEKKDEKNISVNIFMDQKESDEFGAAEMMISLLAASKHTDENEDKTDIEHFNKTNEGIFSVLGELKKDNKGFWWDFYVTKLYDLIKSKNIEAYSYYISQSAGTDEVKKWISDHQSLVQRLENWIKQ